MRVTKKRTCLLFSLLLVAGIGWAADIPPAEEQIQAAILAAPEEYREGAAVLGYDAEGTLVTLREGSNEMICLADDPKQEELSVACYHEDLEPYMERGRVLIAEGVRGPKRNEVRWGEIESGALAMSREPRTLYVLSGTSYDAEAHEFENPYLRWVIYVPFATTESTGLSSKPTETAPWLMFPGTAGAHIMITPPRG